MNDAKRFYEQIKEEREKKRLGKEALETERKLGPEAPEEARQRLNKEDAPAIGAATETAEKPAERIQPAHTSPADATKQQPAPLAIASLVLGILGLLLWWFPLVGPTLGILSLVCSSKARKFVRISPEKYAGGLATAGLVLGIITVTLSTLVTCAVTCTSVALEAKNIEQASKGV